MRSFICAVLLGAGVCTANRQEPPPDTYTVDFLVNDGTILYDTAFWTGLCNRLGSDALVPSISPYVVVTMGAVTDYFKRKKGGSSWCQMFISHVNHQWSDNGLDWQTPEFSPYSNPDGGSKYGWPKTNIDGDERKVLSCWGYSYNTNNMIAGGCCSASYDEYITVVSNEQVNNSTLGLNSRNAGWGQPFTIAYGVSNTTAAQIERAVAVAVDAEKAAALSAAIAAAKKELPPNTTTVKLMATD
jgi:hypothetical protein